MNAHYLFGSRLSNFIRLLWHNRKDINWGKYKGRILNILIVILPLEVEGLIERAIYKRRIRETKIRQAPIYVVGHWRSGTTYLFNLLSCDPNHAYMNSMHTYMFDHFLLLYKFLTPFFNRALDGSRPGDAMDFSLDSPQEECYAIANIIEDTFSHLITFPQNAAHYLDMNFEDSMSNRQKKRWMHANLYILKKMTYAHDGKRMLFKSPDNTCKTGMLHKMYPNAKFIHIYRSPYDVVLSTLNMLKEGVPLMTLEDMPGDEELEDFVLYMYTRLYHQYFRDLEMLPPENVIEISYDELVQDPQQILERIYKHLHLPGYEVAKPCFQEHIDSQKNYKRNHFTLPTRLHRKINQQLKFFFEHYDIPMIEVDEAEES